MSDGARTTVGSGCVPGRLPSTSVTGVELPASAVVTDLAAVQAQRTTRRAYVVELVALIVAATAGVTSWRWGEGRLDALAAVGTVAFAAAVAAAFHRDLRHPQADWVTARAVAESIKSAAWRYAVGGEPFPAGRDGADEAFLRYVTTAMATVGHLALPVVPATATEISGGMRALRAEPPDRRKAAYLAGRLDDQLSYYTRQAGRNDRARRLWFRVGIAAYLAGLAGGALRFLDVVDIDLVGISAAVAGAAVAWSQLNQHRTLATAYSLTTRQLAVARDRLGSGTDDDWAGYVDSVEDLMAREHSVWLTNRAGRGIAGGP